MSPGFINALLNHANASYELKEYYKTLNDLDRVISIKPDTSLAHFTQGLAYTKLREFNKALRAFSRPPN
ncbi:MAG: hypothetical protein HWD62_03435 [Cyclobacteriaceae bacterium]|nr:MAG: hypothetical protein HWD62_03435 [Cyclobacteriaceae bacterium]